MPCRVPLTCSTRLVCATLHLALNEPSSVQGFQPQNPLLATRINHAFAFILFTTAASRHFRPLSKVARSIEETWTDQQGQIYGRGHFLIFQRRPVPLRHMRGLTALWTPLFLPTTMAPPFGIPYAHQRVPGQFEPMLVWLTRVSLIAT